MLHVGNDIVDLTLPNAKNKSKDTRFLKRAFLPDEEARILNDRQPDALLWALWSGKEAAYKVIQKDHLDITSTPRCYRIILDHEEAGDRRHGMSHQEQCLTGTVETPQGTIPLEIRLTPEYVHSLATSCTPDQGCDVFWQVERMPRAARLSAAYESWFVREAAKRHISRYHPDSIRDMDIRRHCVSRGLGPPMLYIRDEATTVDLSLSHDGNFVAHAFTILS